MEVENLTELPREGDPLEKVGEELLGKEAAQVNETPAESSTGSNENGNAPSQGGAPEGAAPEQVTPPPSTPTQDNVPFNKHPQWIRQQSEMAELRQRNEQMSAYLQQIPGYLDSMRQQLTSREAPIPDWFRELYGDSPKAWQLYQQREAQMYQQVQQNVLQSIAQQQQYGEQVTTYWNGQVENEFQKLEQSGKQFDREELKAVLLNYRPVGDDGLLDFSKAYDILEAQKAKATQLAQGEARKKIAAATAPTPAGESKAKDYTTTAEIRNKNWHSL